MSPVWRKSSRSMNSGGECVEVVALTGAVGVRDSKDPDAGHLVLDRSRFAALLGRIRNGELHP